MASWRFMPWVATLRAVTQTSEEETWNIRDRNHLFLFQPKPKLPRPTCTKTETESEHLISTETKSSFRPLFSGVYDLCRCGISPDDFLAFWNLLESLPNEYNLLVFTFHLNVADFKKKLPNGSSAPKSPWSQTQTKIQGETAHIHMRRADAPTECRLSRVQTLQTEDYNQGRPVSIQIKINGLKMTDECQQLNANNPASIYVCFRSFSTETTHTFGRNRNSCHYILPKQKTDRNCIFHRFRRRNRNQISIGLYETPSDRWSAGQ